MGHVQREVEWGRVRRDLRSQPTMVGQLPPVQVAVKVVESSDENS